MKPAPRRRSKRVLRPSTEQPRRNVNHGRDEHGTGVFEVKSECAVRSLSALEMQENPLSLGGSERQANDVSRNRDLCGHDRAPHHLTFPAAVRVLERNEGVRSTSRCGLFGGVRCLHFSARRQSEESANQRLPCEPTRPAAETGDGSESV